MRAEKASPPSEPTAATSGAWGLHFPIDYSPRSNDIFVGMQLSWPVLRPGRGSDCSDTQC